MGKLDKQTRQLIRRYKQLTTQFNDLKDQGWYVGRNHPDADNANTRVRQPSTIIEAFRNDKKPFIELGNNSLGQKRYYRSQTTYSQFWEHLRPDRRKWQTIFMSNNLAFDIVVCLVDIDDQGGGPESTQALAEYVGQKYFGGKAYIEQSPGGTGCHVYFVLNVAFKKARDVRLVLNASAKYSASTLERVMQADPFVQSFEGKANVCSIMGEPTEWQRGDDGLWTIVHRGSLVKCPYILPSNSSLGAGVGLSAVDVNIKVQEAFRQKPEASHYDGRHSRDATLRYARSLNENGVIPFKLCQHQYTMLKELAVENELLTIYETHDRPMKTPEGQRVLMSGGMASKGRAALIGPGPALTAEHRAFQPIWEEIQRKTLKDRTA